MLAGTAITNPDWILCIPRRLCNWWKPKSLERLRSAHFCRLLVRACSVKSSSTATPRHQQWHPEMIALLIVWLEPSLGISRVLTVVLAHLMRKVLLCLLKRSPYLENCISNILYLFSIPLLSLDWGNRVLYAQSQPQSPCWLNIPVQHRQLNANSTTYLLYIIAERWLVTTSKLARL